MRKQLVSAFLTWAVVLGTISSGSFATTSKGINPGLIPYPIDPDREPLAAALVRNNVWAEDPDEAARIHRDSKPRAGKRSAYADTRDNYFNHASELEGEPIEENERAFREYFIFVNIDPNGSIPATIWTGDNSSYSGYIKGDKLRNALALLTAADNTTRLDKATYDLYLRTVWQLGNQPLDVRKMFYDKAYSALMIKNLQAAANAVFGADVPLKAAVATRLARRPAKPAATSRKASVVTPVPQQSAKPAADGSIKQRTIDAYKAAFSVGTPEGQSASQDWAFRQNVIRKLDLRDVDPDLVTYFRLLDEKLTVGIPLFKALEDSEVEYWQEVEREEYEDQKARDLRIPRENEGWRRRLDRAAADLNKETEAAFVRIAAKYDPPMAAARKRLEMKYGVTFHDRPKQ